MRNFGQLLLVGVAGVVGFKLLAALILPLLGFTFALLGLLVKLAIAGAVVWFVFSLLRGRERKSEA